MALLKEEEVVAEDNDDMQSNTKAKLAKYK
jgi:hypothetical protein